MERTDNGVLCTERQRKALTSKSPDLRSAAYGWPCEHLIDRFECFFFTNRRLQDVCFNWKVNSSFFSHPYKEVRGLSVCSVPVCVCVCTHACYYFFQLGPVFYSFHYFPQSPFSSKPNNVLDGLSNPVISQDSRQPGR